jgi:hypothetical protein
LQTGARRHVSIVVLFLEREERVEDTLCGSAGAEGKVDDNWSIGLTLRSRRSLLRFGYEGSCGTSGL